MYFSEGVCCRTYKTERRFEHCVSLYDDLFRGDWKGTLRVPGMEEEAGGSTRDLRDTYSESELSIDEASGRVIVWVRSSDGGRCHIGDLV